MFVVIIDTQRIHDQDNHSRLFPSKLIVIKYLKFYNIFVQVASDLSSVKVYKRDFKRIPWKKVDALTFLQN